MKAECVTNTEDWTPGEERSFLEAQARRERVTKRRHDGVMRVAVKHNSFSSPAELANWLIEHADELRDALQPYDSGARAGSVDHRE